MIEKNFFGEINGREVSLYILKNDRLEVTLSDYGATIIRVRLTLKNGEVRDLIRGYDSLDSYMNADGYLGAVVGRVGNRICKGEFTLDGEKYELYCNNGVNHLHGGKIGFDKKIYNAVIEGDSILFSAVSPDGEEGYPGNLTLKVVYTFDDEDRLTLDYEAVCDADTVANFTNHAYFNLAGYASCDVKGHIARIAADYITETDDELIPTGTLMPVDGTMYDLRTPRAIEGEYDDNFVLNASGKDFDEPKLVCEVSEPTSGRAVRVLTTMPGMQLYTGNMMEGGIPFKGGVPSARHSAFCLETQRWPDSPNHDNFTDCTLRAGEKFTSRTVYEFTAG